jgi:UPF0716 protein FxsA
MIALLAVLLPIAELYVIVVVATKIGVLNTIGLLILVSVVGGWLVKREGLGVLRRLQRSAEAGEVPHRELVDGFLILLAGMLLTIPGFITDIPGVLLLLPPVRMAVRGMVVRSFKKRTSFAVRFVDGFGRRVEFGGGGIHDVDSRDVGSRDVDSRDAERRRRPPELDQ